jgi:hypothetical protein
MIRAKMVGRPEYFRTVRRPFAGFVEDPGNAAAHRGAAHEQEELAL